MGQLFIISTPIGNLSDISLRAISTLKEADVVFSENPNTTRKLLTKYDLKCNLKKYNQHASDKVLQEIFSFLKAEKKVALVSEAGTPGISDPGSKLVSDVRENLAETIITPIPGASALSTLLSVAGIGTDKFLFLGFLPHKKGRQKVIQEIIESNYSVVLYESKHRLLKLLEELKNHGLKDRKILIGREMTKLNETFYFDLVENLEEYFKNNPVENKGEFSMVIKKAAKS
ncbi:MAG: 16S rRNA (cytidine(1402)-2'-O)-methyltransferase [Candidatus Pacebacteria bacterium]|nr:16S rRNA (cytidine(1402)-2'-O)-methyltransferase [Candidatus Paceibacterota bacterium]